MSTILQSGSYTSTGSALALSLEQGVDYFELYIQGDATGSNWNSAASPGVVKLAKWFQGMASGSAFTVQNTAGAATDQSTFIQTGGFTYFDSQSPTQYAPTAITGFTAANPGVVTSTAHGLTTGDLVRIYGIVGGLSQLGGLIFNVTVTGANSFTVPINTTSLGAYGSGGFVQKLFSPFRLYVPQEVDVIAMSQAANMVITTSRPHNYSVGAVIRVRVPSSAFGMIQADGLVANVLSVTANSITTDINSSGFSAFTFPAITSLPFTYPQVVPVGEAATSLLSATQNQGSRGLVLGSSVVGPNGALVYWNAWKQ